MRSDLHVIVDADTIVQRIGYLSLANEDKYCQAVVENITDIYRKAVLSYCETREESISDLDTIVTLCFTSNDRPRYRSQYDSFEIYKGSRPSGEDKVGPKCIEPMMGVIRDMCERREWLCVESDATQMEADDRVCMLAHFSRKEGISYLVVGVDKDLMQIPGHHYNFIDNSHHYIGVAEASYCFWLQMLKGDSSDNIRGIPGVGAVKAKRILQDIYPDKYGETVIGVYDSTYPHSKEESANRFRENYWKLKLATTMDELGASAS